MRALICREWGGIDGLAVGEMPVPEPVKGEIVAAALEPRAGAVIDADAILAFCRERLAPYKVPSRLVFKRASDFPRTATGKIHKPGLKEELSAKE